MAELIAKRLVEFSREILDYFFFSQYVVWKVSKNALKEHSKKEEVFVLNDILFFLTGWLFCPSLLPPLPPQKAVKQRETVRNQRLQGSCRFSLHF